MGIQISGGGPEHIYESETDADGDITAAIGPREEVVRGWDCKHLTKSLYLSDADGFSEIRKEPFCEELRRRVPMNCYCCWGERA